MTALLFTVTDVVADRFAESPQLLVRLRIEESTAATIHALALRVQLMIEPQRRRYDDDESSTLAELFGGRERWRDTLRPFLWTTTSTVVRGFEGSLDIDLPVPCSYDLEVSAGKFLHVVNSGEIPIRLLFSGTVFTRGSNGFGVEQVPWDLEAAHRFPAAVWHELMDQFFPGSGWIRMGRDSLDALLRFRAERGLVSWESVVDELLVAADAHDPEAVP